ncbi:dedicator of cytokinesis protein 11-like isoform X2 [Symsagittifera roscoffensis]|uniref:dedicator of cytokinesis protein 11-like isoform X2 n=1 Tax=Symsagittifera roscoffensis TaxID=84072 RepID=UPI00307C3B47
MERKFVKSRKAQKAAELRVSANVSIQETKNQVLPDVSLLEVGNYEENAQKQIALLRDPIEKDLLTFPADDFKWVKKGRVLSTAVNPTVVSAELLKVEAPFTKECIDFYRSDYESIQFKHANLSGSYFSLLRDSSVADASTNELTGSSHLFSALPTQRFELDVENSINLSQQIRENNIVKQGYLWKTPFNRKGEKHFFSKNSFKKRFFALKQIQDGSFNLDYWKDEKKEVHKGCLNLESCLSASKLPLSKSSFSSGGSKFVIELHFENRQILQVATESEAEQEEWASVLHRAIITSNSLDAQSCSNQSVGTVDDESYNSDVSDVSDVNQQQHAPSSRTKSLSNTFVSKSKTLAPFAPGSTKDPELGSDIQRYCKETDRSVAEARKKDRLSLFSIYTDLDAEEQTYLEMEDNMKFYKEDDMAPPYQPANKGRLDILMTLEKLDFPLKVAQDGTKQYNMEPFFTVISLHNVNSGLKISEDIWIDGNPGPVWKMIKYDDLPVNPDNPNQSQQPQKTVRSHIVDDSRVNFLKEVVFTVPEDTPIEHLFVYVRIEKVLQGAITSSFDVYGKSGIDQENKSVQKYLKQLHMFCQKFGSRFRTPFCWAAVPVPANLVSTYADEAKGVHRISSPLVKIDQCKLGPESVKRNLVDSKNYLDRPEKFANRFGFLPDANIVFTFQNMTFMDSNQTEVLNPFLVPKANEKQTTNQRMSKDVFKRLAREAFLFSPFSHLIDNPHSEYVNTMFVNQMRLKFDSQKVFAKARNIACNVKFFENDSCQAASLLCIYNAILGQNSCFTDQYTTSIAHHNTNPDYQDEIKIELPAELNSKHHILFTFYHVSCDQVSKLTSNSATVGKKAGASLSSLETSVGYAWISLGSILDQSSFKDSTGTLEFSTAIPVAASLVPGYLSFDSDEPMPLQKSSLENMTSTSQKLDRIKLLDGGKNIFNFSCKIRSSVLPHSKFLRNLFENSTKTAEIDASGGTQSFAHCEEAPSVSPTDSESSAVTVLQNGGEQVTGKIVKGVDILQHVKAAHAIDEAELVAYLPIIVNKVLDLITKTNSDVQINIMRFLVHVASTLDRIGRIHLLTDYTRLVFRTGPSERVAANTNRSSVHYRIVSSLVSLLSFTSGDEFFYRNLLYFTWVFFDIVVKSMAQTILREQKTKIPRADWFSEIYNETLAQLVTSLSQQIMDRNGALFKETFVANRSLAFFLKNLLSVMDRGKVFDLIKIYWTKFGNLNLADGKGVVKLRVEFLSIVCTHEHFVALSLPVIARNKHFGTVWTKDFNREFTLNEEFFGKHFLSALALGEVSFDFNDVPKIRSGAICLLRNILAKLSADTRYSNEHNQTIVTSLFVPLFGIVVQNVNRLNFSGNTLLLHPSSHRPLSRSISTESISELVHGNSEHPVQKQSSVAFSPVEYSGSRKSSSSTVRFDTLDSQEIRNLLLAFLHVLKYCNVDILSNWWDYSSDEQQYGFLSALKICLDCFQYNPNKSFNYSRNYTSEDETTTTTNNSGSNRKFSTMREIYTNSTFNAPSAQLSNGGSCREKFSGVPVVASGVGGGGDSLNEKTTGGFVASSMGGHSVAIRPKTITLTWMASNGEDTNTTTNCSVSNGVFSPNLSDNGLSSLKEANLATETGLVVLDTVDALAAHFRKRMEALQSGSVTLTSLFEIYLGFLRANHSETLLQQAFASMRLLNSKFPMMLFKGDPSLCGRMCFELIHCFSARLESTRYHSCMLLYLLMRNNFIFTARQNCTRVHLQSIVAVSQLVGDMSVTTNPKFQESLALVNNLAASDRGMTHTKLPGIVNDLTKTIRKVLIATSQMKEHEEEPEMLLHLQHSLADSYAGTPALRQTWLESMAKKHTEQAYYSEAAMCYLHIAAMHAEYLKANGQAVANPISTANIKTTTFANKKISISGMQSAAANSLITQSPVMSSSLSSTRNQPNATAVNNFANTLIPTGKCLFREISPNIEEDEVAVLEEKGSLQDDCFSQEIFVKLLETAIENLWQSQRFELVPKVIQLILPYYDKTRSYEKLVDLHNQCSKSYVKMMEVYNSGRRFLASYFRIAFFGKIFGPDDGQQYIYKEPNVTSLAAVSERLNKLYGDRLGQENFKLLHDSDVVAKNLDPKMGFLQITHVEPYFEENERSDHRAITTTTDFDMHNNVNKFVFEAPFTRPADGSAPEQARHATQLNEQYIRKTILRTKHCFPYVEKRIVVDMVQSFELSPIEVACESMKRSIKDLKAVTVSKQPDMKRLQLKLQGCVGTQVNAGPMAYARAFLEDEKQYGFPANKVKELKRIYIDFVATCADALELNGRLIKSDQFEFHENLKLSFKLLVEKLAAILKMNITDKGTIEWANNPVPTIISATDSPAMRRGNMMPSIGSSVSTTQSYSGENRRNSTKILSEISKTSNSDKFG